MYRPLELGENDDVHTGYARTSGSVRSVDVLVAFSEFDCKHTCSCSLYSVNGSHERFYVLIEPDLTGSQTVELRNFHSGFDTDLSKSGRPTPVGEIYRPRLQHGL